jgi:TatD DNase family protein
MRLFDSHCHLQDERLGADLDGVVARARAAGVERLVTAGVDEADWPAAAGVARRHAGVSAAYGLHPWFVAGRSPRWLDALRALLAADPSAALGEVGLDRAVEPREDAVQERVFLDQLRLARDLGRPVVVHCRRAWGRMLDLLRAEGPHPPGLVFHSYSGAADLVPALAELGGRFSFSGSITFPANRRGPLAAAAAPADRLLIETDAPDLRPREAADGPGAQGVPNEPSRLPQVLRAVARIRGVAEEELAHVTFENARAVFG